MNNLEKLANIGIRAIKISRDTGLDQDLISRFLSSHGKMELDEETEGTLLNYYSEVNQGKWTETEDYETFNTGLDSDNLAYMDFISWAKCYVGYDRVAKIINNLVPYNANAVDGNIFKLIKDKNPTLMPIFEYNGQLLPYQAENFIAIGYVDISKCDYGETLKTISRDLQALPLIDRVKAVVNSNIIGLTVDMDLIIKLLGDETITATEIAKETGLSRGTVGNLRNGKAAIDDARLNTLIKLQDYAIEKGLKEK